MNIASSPSKKYFLLAMLIGIVMGYGLFFLGEDNSDPYAKIAILENRIADLESRLAQQNLTLSGSASVKSSTVTMTAAKNNSIIESGQQLLENSIEDVSISSPAAQDTQQMLKELGTRNDSNPRTFSERINDFLSTNPGKENIAIASKAVVDMAENKESMPDFELEAIYQKQADPDLKRVVAQVLSMRGDNSLIEKQMNESRMGLGSDNPEVRQKTLVELAKTRYAGAADLIAPLLHDKNTGVKLDALLALRATGNESHIHLVQDLVGHPDPSVSWLANDVINNLQNLSEKARTRLSSNDIAAELPPIMIQ